jgi:RNA polymerase sigma-70 factor (ECF subfamily)
MEQNDSFEVVMNCLRAGDNDAASAILGRFTHRLMTLARARLASLSNSRGDIEDVLQSVYKSFFTRYSQGEFNVTDWNELWGLLTIITLRKCANRQTYLKARRRDVRREVSTTGHSDSSGLGWVLVDREPTPLEAAALADTVEELVRGLDPPDRVTVSMLLQGYNAREISETLTCSERTVRRVRTRLKDRLKRLYDPGEQPRRA